MKEGIVLNGSLKVDDRTDQENNLQLKIGTNCFGRIGIISRRVLSSAGSMEKKVRMNNVLRT